MFCKSCGTEISDLAKVCSNCGEITYVNTENNNTNTNTNTNTKELIINDRGGLGWAFLGFMFPLPALIVALILKDTKPNTSKSVLKGAIISMICSIVLSIISMLIFSMSIFAIF